MKILSLSFKNLNSLYGEWSVDFTDAAYRQDGLFVLSGPTGAGKSTILDAICLALYGQTPRLGKITQNNNEIMSKHTADCSALLCFETQGTRYYAKFEQRKSRNNPNGKLQDVERSVAENTPDNIICRKKTEINDEIIRITGMDFPRFTRSILLAQGAFDSFLKAKDEEKSMLLEQITGTEIYSEISKSIFERTKAEKEKIQELETKILSFPTLSAEETEQLAEQKNNLDALLEKSKSSLKQIQDNLAWVRETARLKEKSAALEDEKTKLQNVKEQKQTDRQMLLKAEKARLLEAEHSLLLHLKKEKNGVMLKKQETEKNIPQLQKQLTDFESKSKELTEKLKQEENAYQLAKPVWEETKRLDILLEKQKQDYAQTLSFLTKEQTALQNMREALQKMLAEKNTVCRQQEEIQKKLGQNKNIETLKQNFGDTKQNLLSLENTVNTGTQIKNKIAELSRALQAEQKNLIQNGQRKQKLLLDRQNTQKELEQTENRLKQLLNGKELREYHTEYAFLEEKRVLLAVIASLEEQRKNLLPNQPCPLCGSLHHPYAENSVPKQDGVTERLKELKNITDQAELCQNTRKKLELSLANSEEQEKNLIQLETNYARQIAEKEKNIAELQKEREKLLGRYEEQKKDLLRQTEPFGITEISAANCGQILSELEKLIAAHEKNIAEKQNADNALQKISAEISAKEAEILVFEKNIQNQKLHAEEAEKEIKRLTDSRQKLLGDKSPQDEEKTLSEKIQALSLEKETVSRQLSGLYQEIAAKNEIIGLCLQQLSDFDQKIREKEEHFLRALKAQNFDSEQEFAQALLDPAKLEELREFFKKLDQDIEINAQQLKENQEKLVREQSKNLCQETENDLLGMEQAIKDNQEQYLKSLGELQGKLNSNARQREISGSLRQELDRQKENVRKWETLNSLVGSADGKKFRTTAQGITFEHVIRYANAKLQLLQKRYLLLRDENSPLSLNVLDNYQGGEIRAVQNLSGGETFIVSLSLALGLAQMASKNVQVDSLFLDEGFGTLDEESLDTALAALASIEQEGKLIGIISHIPLLKERINTQINVIPTNGGKSILEGAGIKKGKEI